jgi:phosphate starvation-inducible PhoH-like protein
MTRHFSVDVEVKERGTRNKRQSTKTVSKSNNIALKYDVKPLNESQRQLMFALEQGMFGIAAGSAGTGKSFLSLNYALNELLSGRTQKIILLRSAVATRDVGHLPGSLEEKGAIYEEPYRNLVNELCGDGTAYEVLTKKGFIEFQLTSFLRGLTFSNCIVVIDEAQNNKWEELRTIVTRVGQDCQLIVCGDTKQSDFDPKREKSGFAQLLEIAKNLPKWFDITTFRPQDIVRSAFVKDFIIEVDRVIP